jgi:protein-tyrosine phosphatase
MIDLHTHVLPGVDDGPDDMVGSVAMAELAADSGTRTLVATPHVRDDHPRVKLDKIQEQAATVNRIVRDYGIDVFVIPGGEVALSSAVALSDDELELATLGGNGRDLLIETPYGPLPTVFEELLHGIVARGFRPTLAHPELNPTFQRDPERLQALVSDGSVLAQLTAASFVGSRRSKQRALAVRAVSEGWAHVIASDAHSAEWRPPDLRPGIEAATRAVPEAAGEIDWMVNSAPLAIVQGVELPPRPPRRDAPKRAFRLGRR